MQATITITADMRKALGLADTSDSTTINTTVKAALTKALGLQVSDLNKKYVREYDYLRQVVNDGDKLTKVQNERMAWLKERLGY